MGLPPAYQVSPQPSPSESSKLYACQVFVGITTASRTVPSVAGLRISGAKPTRPSSVVSFAA